MAQRCCNRRWPLQRLEPVLGVRDLGNVGGWRYGRSRWRIASTHTHPAHGRSRRMSGTSGSGASWSWRAFLFPIGLIQVVTARRGHPHEGALLGHDRNGRGSKTVGGSAVSGVTASGGDRECVYVIRIDGKRVNTNNA